MKPSPARTRATGAGASINAVAKRAGVSIATVSRVINGIANKASPETIARVREAIAALDYRPTSAGRALRQQTSRLVAVLAANVANPTMAAVAASVEVALRREGLVMVLCDTHDQPDLQDEYLKEMRAHQARAIVLLGAVRSPQLDRMRDGTTPIVFVNRRDPDDPAAPFVGIDNAAAGRDVAVHCLSAVTGPIALIHASLASSAVADRVAAVVSTIEAAGRPLLMAGAKRPEERDHLSVGYRAMGDILASDGHRDARPEAVICTSDLLAFGAHRRLVEETGSEPPLFFGFDDSPLNPWIAPWLSSIQIPFDAYGAAIVDILAGRASGQRLLPYRFMVRDGSVRG